MFYSKFCYDNNGRQNADVHKEISRDVVVITRNNCPLSEGLVATGSIIQFMMIKYRNGEMYNVVMSLHECSGLICDLSFDDLENMVNLNNYIKNCEDNGAEFNMDKYHALYFLVASRIKQIEKVIKGGY